MRIELNLASRGVKNQRRFYVLAGTAVAVLLVAAVIQAGWWFRDWYSGRGLAQRIEALRADVSRSEAERRRLEQQLQQPQSRDVMARAYFLNSLILQKSVSWTQIFMDLEKLVPDRVQVVSITPAVLDNNLIRLDMNVSGESLEKILEFMRRIETSEKFGTPIPRTETPPQGRAETGTLVTLEVMYAQK